jgi:hypothetical protein
MIARRLSVMHPTSAHFSNQPQPEPEGTDTQLMEPTNPHLCVTNSNEHPWATGL